jgi:hypothetical protein
VAHRCSREGTPWHKSSFSGGNGGNCVEVASYNSVIVVRDTKDHGHGRVRWFTPAGWRAFVAGVRNGEFGLDESARLP